VEHGRPSGSGAAGRGRGLTRATGAAPSGAERCGPGPGVAGEAAAACVEAMREREAGEKKGGPEYYTAYVHRADILADEHVWAGLCGGRGARYVGF
jgi:hypothetical protein